MEQHHILKVKNVVVKSVCYFMEYIICKLFVGRGVGGSLFLPRRQGSNPLRILVSTYQYTEFHIMFMIAGTLRGGAD